MILNGDCLDLMKNIESGSIDMILADLPYGTTACKWDTIIPFDKLWEQYERIIKPNGAIVLTASQPFSSALVMSNPKMFKYEWIWNKIRGSNFFNLKNRPLKTQEQILIFSKQTNFTFNPEKVLRSEKSLKRDPIGKTRIGYATKKHIINHYNSEFETKCSYSIDGMKHPIDIIEFSIVEKGVYKLKHPTKKPVALFEYLIKTYTNENDLVLDNCAGSGTTAIACLNTNRNYICMEKDENYYNIGLKRVKEWHDKNQTEIF